VGNNGTGVRPLPFAGIDPAAYQGIAGDYARILDPHTETDPVATICETLVMFGNAIGHRPRRVIEKVSHHTNLFLCKIGGTSESRKGSSTARVRDLYARVDDLLGDWAITSGLLSGEGLVYHVRDPSTQVDKDNVPVDAGVEDKRLMVVEPEFARVLTVAAREGSSLSTGMRQAWETGDLRNLGRQSKDRATGAHISIIGDVTPEELLERLTTTDIYNGFANRFIFAHTQRTKFLPFPDDPDPAAMKELCGRLEKAIQFAQAVDQIAFMPLAAAMYAAVYEPLTSPTLSGQAKTMLARGAPQVIRLAMIYALMDCKRRIDVPHLRAALAVWEYAERSVQYYFGKSTGNHDADTILSALKGRQRSMPQRN
jgi:hypothetical protein